MAKAPRKAKKKAPSRKKKSVPKKYAKPLSLAGMGFMDAVDTLLTAPKKGPMKKKK